MGEGEGVRDLVSDGSPGRGNVEGDMGVDEGVVFVVVVWEWAARARAGGGVTVREEEASARAGGHESVRTMCQLHTEGTQYGCGHYVIVRPLNTPARHPQLTSSQTNKYDKRDCASRYCIFSIAHPPNCPSCPSCKRVSLPHPRLAQPTNQPPKVLWARPQRNHHRSHHGLLLRVSVVVPRRWCPIDYSPQEG